MGFKIFNCFGGWRNGGDSQEPHIFSASRSKRSFGTDLGSLFGEKVIGLFGEGRGWVFSSGARLWSARA